MGATELEATDDRMEQQCAARGHEVMVALMMRDIKRERERESARDGRQR